MANCGHGTAVLFVNTAVCFYTLGYMFVVNQALIQKAQKILSASPNIYWVLGGSATGKSTICQTISQMTQATVYDMDAFIYGHYQPHYSPERHPASVAWFGAESPLAWVMALSWEEFDALNQATNAEFLDLLADDLSPTNLTSPLLIDGGFTHPSIIAQAAHLPNIVCLDAPRQMVIQEWETQTERLAMKSWIHDLLNGEAMWSKFLEHDRRMNETMVRESDALGVRVFRRDEDTAVYTLAQQIINYFNFAASEHKSHSR
ncbi:MAG: hypothetical protein GY796_16950 [Chloroflexi bacterium]|nr:hypothetical protein [Chloroflexota bacterium]